MISASAPISRFQSAPRMRSSSPARSKRSSASRRPACGASYSFQRFNRRESFMRRLGGRPAPHRAAVYRNKLIQKGPTMPGCLWSNSPQAMKKPLLIGVVFVVLAGAALAYFYFAPRNDGASQGTTTAAPPARTKGKGGSDPNRATPVVAEPARVGDINIFLNGLGTITPLRTVTVRSRVDGELQQVAFTEGQLVKAGDLLAQVDPRPFQVQLMQAEGQMAKDQALLDNARIDLERYKTLFEQDSIAKQQVDTQAALVRQYEGMVQTDRSQIDNARLQLTYARVTAPVSGRL